MNLPRTCFTSNCSPKGRSLLLLAALILCVHLGTSFRGNAQGQFSARLWRADSGLPVNHVHSVVQSVDGYLWIATSEAVVRFNGFEFERVAGLSPIDLSGPASEPIRLFATADGSAWLSTPGGSLHRISGLTAKEALPGTSAADPSPVTQVMSLPTGVIAAKRGAEVWAFENGGRSRLDPVPSELSGALQDDLESRAQRGRINASGHPQPLLDRSGSRWLPDDTTGLTVTSPGGLPRQVSLPEIGPDFEVTELYQDREGNVWVATKIFGLALFRKAQLGLSELDRPEQRQAALAVMEDSRGSIWVACQNGEMLEIRDGVTRRHDLPSDGAGTEPRALYEDRSGGIWVTTTNGPVLRWLGSRFVEQFFENGPTNVGALYQDPEGRLWMGGPGGLSKALGQQVTPVGAESNFPGGEVTVLTGGMEGELWLGTADGFVLRNGDGRFQSLGLPAQTGYSRISDILVESTDRIWVTSLGGGLLLFNGSTWHRFTGDEGLPNSNLTSITADQMEHLWLGSTKGIFRVTKDSLLARTRNARIPIHWLRVDQADKGPARECAANSSPGVWRARNGSIWFATAQGAIHVDPSRTDLNLTPPPVFIEAAEANGLPLIWIGQKATGGPGKSRLDFTFHGISFSAPDKVTYRARLLGYEDGWRDLGTRREINYEAVPPGDYIFSVLALNNAGIASERPATLAITIRPNFWETEWFFIQATILLIIVAGAVGWLIARVRMKRRLALLSITNAREAERARIARDLHDDLGASLTEISLLAGLSAEQAEGSGFEESLEELSDKSRAVSQALDEIVWAANPTEDSFVSLVDYIAGFAHEFLDRAGITLRLDVPSDLPDSPMDTTLRHSIFLAVREAFNNIAKHSEASTAWLHISLENQILDIRIEDDGCGISDEVLKRGDGLQNFHERMASCGGEFHLDRREGGGTVVRFKVPLA